MPTLEMMLTTKQTEYQQLLRMQAELTQNLQQVNASLLRTEGAIVALRALTVAVPVPEDDEVAYTNGTPS